jgi:hypothetical protein
MKRLLACLILCACSLASGAPPLRDVLMTTGRSVEDFWERFSVVNCSEMVSQQKLDKSGKLICRKDTTYDYVVLARKAGRDLVVEESRVSVRSTGKDKNMSLLVTNGFPALLFIFHPYFQGSYEFSQPVEADFGGQPALQIQFRQAHDGRSPSCLRLRGRDFPLEWAGTAWIEPQTGSVVKITAGLGAGMQEFGLQGLSAEVTYAPVEFSGAGLRQWLPAEAVIAAQTAQQRWQNIHRFTNYKHFSVDVNSKTEAPKQAPPGVTDR